MVTFCVKGMVTCCAGIGAWIELPCRLFVLLEPGATGVHGDFVVNLFHSLLQAIDDFGVLSSNIVLFANVFAQIK